MNCVWDNEGSAFKGYWRIRYVKDDYLYINHYSLKFSLKRVVSLSRGHVVGNTHLHFVYDQGGLKARPYLIPNFNC